MAEFERLSPLALCHQNNHPGRISRNERWFCPSRNNTIWQTGIITHSITATPPAALIFSIMSFASSLVTPCLRTAGTFSTRFHHGMLQSLSKCGPNLSALLGCEGSNPFYKLNDLIGRLEGTALQRSYYSTKSNVCPGGSKSCKELHGLRMKGDKRKMAGKNEFIYLE
nr:hypothetical protein Iba_chr09aCG15110 [Ipomoea batatas]